MNWWTLLFSGADNSTPAIGRVLGALLFVNLLCALPAVIVGVLLAAKVEWATWSALLTALALYVPAIVGSIVVLIRVTNPTEPTP
jgi:hypothetical protein